EEVRGKMLTRRQDGAREPGLAAQVPILTLSAVSAGYRKKMVVHDVTLEVAPRDCLALVGESGSGKTTLARSVAGLHSDRKGGIGLKGVPLADSARDRARATR